MDANVSVLPEIGIGTRLSDYATFDLRVEGMGAGGMGLVVWGPNAARGGQMQAAKLLRPDRLQGLSQQERGALFAEFEREALTWSHLWPHPFLITADALTRLPGWDNLPILAIEYAPEGSLRDWLNRARREGGAIALRVVLRWAQQIAAALVAIHTRDPEHEREALVHLDLKPENVLINDQGWALLSDFGLTRILAESSLSYHPDSAVPSDDRSRAPQFTHDLHRAQVPLSHEVRIAAIKNLLERSNTLPPDRIADTNEPDQAESTAEGISQHEMGSLYVTRSVRIATLPTPSAIGSRGGVAGTPPYMPPEQWLGVSATTPSSDLYAFGVLLFELFAGVPAPHCFPHQPERFAATALSGSSLSPMQRWYEAHRHGPSRRLSDPEMRALSHGPLHELMDSPAGTQQARDGLQQLEGIIAACLAPRPEQRPSAQELQRAVGELAESLGYARVKIPDVFPHTTEHEAIYWRRLAVTFGNIGRLETRLDLQERALKYAPNDPVQWASLGGAYSNLGRYEEALVSYQKAEALLTPAHYLNHDALTYTLPYNQGIAMDALRRFAEAVAAYERSLIRKPDKVDALNNMAATYAMWAESSEAMPQQRVERLRKALDVVDRALAIEQHHLSAKRMRPLIIEALAAAEIALRASRGHE